MGGDALGQRSLDRSAIAKVDVVEEIGPGQG